MKISRFNGKEERLILTGMIVNGPICGRIASKWKEKLFRSDWSNLVAGWCVNYHLRYGKAPNRKIEDLFNRWSEKTKDKATVEMVERFLSTLSDDYKRLKKEINPDYVLDVASRHFALIQTERLKESLEACIDDANPDKANELVIGFNQIKLGVGEGIDVLSDKEAWKQAFETMCDPVIKFPGPLGLFIGDSLEREGFVSFEGPEGRGKSMWLQEVAFRGVLQRKRVAFFELGDMSRDQIMRRFAKRIAKRPIKAGQFKVPIAFTRKDGHRECRIRNEDRICKQDLTVKGVMKACRGLEEDKIKSHDSYWKLFCYPTDMLHMRDIQTVLSDLQRIGWTADVVVIDYADNLNMSYPKLEGRDRINQAWKDMRKLSIVNHCLVITATQTNAASNDVEIISRRHFSEDKRKRAHISSGFGLNQTEKEKEKGVMRLNQIKKRDGHYIEKRCVYVVGCFAICNPAVKSCW